MVEFSKRLTVDVLNEINEMIIDFNKPDDQGGNADGGDNSESSSDGSSGTLILDAACAPDT